MINFPAKTSGVRLAGQYVPELKLVFIFAQHPHYMVQVAELTTFNLETLAQQVAKLLEEARDEGFRHGQAHVRQALGVS